jgi:hypothetical protein
VQIFHMAVAADQTTYGGSSNQIQRTGQPNLHPLPDPCRKTPTHGGQVLLCEGCLATSRYLIQHSGATYSRAHHPHLVEIDASTGIGGQVQSHAGTHLHHLKHLEGKMSTSFSERGYIGGSPDSYHQTGHSNIPACLHNS